MPRGGFGRLQVLPFVDASIANCMVCIKLPNWFKVDYQSDIDEAFDSFSQVIRRSYESGCPVIDGNNRTNRTYGNSLIIVSFILCLGILQVLSFKRYFIPLKVGQFHILEILSISRYRISVLVIWKDQRVICRRNHSSFHINFPSLHYTSQF